jgi:hypothetical protein
MSKKKFRLFVPAFVLALSLVISGCHSHHIDSLIDNRTGAAIHQVEIDYPSASFGIDTLTPGQVYKYKFQVQGKGPLKVQYTDSTGKQVQLQGSILSDGDEGQYLVILLPDGQVQWVPSLNIKN